MKPRTPEVTPQDDLFRSRLENLIAPRHPLVLLARQIDWEGLNTEFGAFYEDAVVGQPPKATRLMVGLLYLKHTYSLSDEALLERWVENPYWQAFCGMEYFQHEPPIHPSSLSRYRTRLGPAGCEELLRRTIVAGLAEGVIEKRDLTEVLVDTTVMEKAITYPTDSKLYLKSLLRLNRVARQSGIELRQSYTRTAKRMAAQIGRYAHAKQFRRMHRELKKLKGRLGRVVRDLERKTASWDVVPEALTRELALAHRLLSQQRTGANKLYSLHAPEVECISKGKAHKRYEFGVKVGVVASLKKPFILAAHALPGRPYDGHTLMRSLAQATLNTGVKIKTAVADKGYRGHETWPGAKDRPAGAAQWHTRRAPLAAHPAAPAQRDRGADRAHEGRRADGPQLAEGHRRRCDACDPVCRRSEPAPAAASDRSFFAPQCTDAAGVASIALLVLAESAAWPKS
jgi:transposase, IS5 family